MSDQAHRMPFSDATNVPRPSRRPCAAVPIRAATMAEGSHQQAQPVRQPSPTSERSISPLGSSHGAPPPSMSMAVPQLYERMNTLMLEMNMLMAQWEVVMSSTLSHGEQQQPPAEAFKGMLTAFGAVTAQYAQYQHQQSHPTPAPQPVAVERKPSTSMITTVQQTASQSRSGTISPDHHHQQEFPAPIGHHPQGRSHNNAEKVRTHHSSEPLDLDRDCIVAVVEFKRQRMKRFACAQFVEPGQYVIVDGDRGQDCGFVVYCSVRNPDGSLGLTQSIENARLDVTRIKAEHGIVRGLASEEDIALLHGEIATNERMALKICRDLVEQMELPMKVVDCEYQFDRRKISFYFESTRSIDFRILTTELYRIFGVRIWLENQNNKVKNVVPDGAFSHSDKSSFQRNGLRTPTL